MKKKHTKVMLDGKPHRLIRSKTKHFGYHLSPDGNEPGIIAVNAKIRGRIELDTYIHEMLHACGRFAKEEWVLETARDIAKALWELGYRKHEISKKPKKARKQSNI